jgi:hypothetical protein
LIDLVTWITLETWRLERACNPFSFIIIYLSLSLFSLTLLILIKIFHYHFAFLYCYLSWQIKSKSGDHGDKDKLREFSLFWYWVRKKKKRYRVHSLLLSEHRIKRWSLIHYLSSAPDPKLQNWSNRVYWTWDSLKKMVVFVLFKNIINFYFIKMYYLMLLMFTIWEIKGSIQRNRNRLKR